MRIARRWLIRGTAGLGVACTVLTGCQTYPAGFGGLTLPSPHYLKHYPQYFPPDPPFPLQRELDTMQNAEGAVPAAPPGGIGPAARGAPVPAPLPAPGAGVPLPGGPVPAPAPVPAPGPGGAGR